MRYRKEDSDGDYTGLWLVDSVECVAQAVKTRLLLWLGEWFLDTKDGTDYSGKILGENKRGTFEREIRSRILNTPNVTRMASFDYSIVDRALTVHAVIDTTYGKTQITLAM